MAKEPTWGIVAMVADPAPLIATMVAHHLDAGASDILLYLDEPNPALMELLKDTPKVRCTLCDEAHWASSVDGKRPPSSGRRQFLNATRAYRESTVDWLLHCDCDEFVWTGESLARELASLDPKVDCLILPNVERVFDRSKPQTSLFEGMFRKPTKNYRWVGPLVYGKFAPYLNRGVTAYIAGKSLTRTGRNLDVSIHTAQRREGGPKPVFARSRSTIVLHFDGITPLHWRAKVLRKVKNATKKQVSDYAPGRRRSFLWMKNNAKDKAAVETFCQQMLTLSWVQQKLLAALGLLRRIPFSPDASLHRHFPSALQTPAEFDAELRKVMPEFTARAE